MIGFENFKNVVEKTKIELENIFPVYLFKLEIIEDKEKVIPELGISGFYQQEVKTIFVYYDSQSNFLLENLQDQVRRCIAHEYIHAVREEKISWENNTLLEILVAEGLAQRFEMEFTNSDEMPRYAKAISEKEIKSFLENYDLNSTNYDYWGIFFGNEKIKLWTGYSAGYFIVNNFLKKNNLKVVQVVHKDSKDFI